MNLISRFWVISLNQSFEKEAIRKDQSVQQEDGAAMEEDQRSDPEPKMDVEDDLNDKVSTVTS